MHTQQHNFILVFLAIIIFLDLKKKKYIAVYRHVFILEKNENKNKRYIHTHDGVNSYRRDLGALEITVWIRPLAVVWQSVLWNTTFALLRPNCSASHR